MANPIFCWDSVAFINFFNGGKDRTPEEISGILEVMELVDRSAATIITCETVIGEVLDAAADLEKLLKRPQFMQISPSGPVIEKVRDLRQSARDASVHVPKFADATFIATAILYRASALHTFDDRLLGLSGHTTVEGLKICKPRGVQTLLGL
jgi:hypothetical protein